MDPQNLFRGYGEYKIKIVRFECEAFLSLDEFYAGIEARRKAEGSPLRSAPDDLPAQDLASPAEKPDGPLSIESLLNAYHARRDPGTANTFHESLFNVQRAVVAALAQPASKKDGPLSMAELHSAYGKEPLSSHEDSLLDVQRAVAEALAHVGERSCKMDPPTHWREMPPVPFSGMVDEEVDKVPPEPFRTEEAEAWEPAPQATVSGAGPFTGTELVVFMEGFVSGGDDCKRTWLTDVVMGHPAEVRQALIQLQALILVEAEVRAARSVAADPPGRDIVLWFWAPGWVTWARGFIDHLDVYREFQGHGAPCPAFYPQPTHWRRELPVPKG